MLGLLVSAMRGCNEGVWSACHGRVCAVCAGPKRYLAARRPCMGCEWTELSGMWVWLMTRSYGIFNLGIRIRIH